MSSKAEGTQGHTVKLDSESAVLRKGPQSTEPDKGKDKTPPC